MIASTIALAVVLSQAVPEPEDGMNDHTKMNIRNAVRSGTSGASVTVISADDKIARLRIDEVVQGTLPADTEVEVPVRGFVKCDLTKGTELLVFFRGKPGALVASGQYELIYEGKIRQYDRAVYLTRTRFEQPSHGLGGGGAVSPARSIPRLFSMAPIWRTASSKPSLPKVSCSISSNRSPISSSCFGPRTLFHAGNTSVSSIAACSSYIRAKASRVRASGSASCAAIALCARARTYSVISRPR